MLGSVVIEVAIGMILIYLVFSLFCSAINEWIARLLALRSVGLRKGINELLADGQDSGLAAVFHDHPLIDVLKPSKAPVLRRFFGSGRDHARYPSYISARTFALAILDSTTDITVPAAPGPARATFKTAPVTPIPPVIQKLLADVQGDAAAMQQRLQDWFNDSMDVVSGWYKARVHVMLFFLALLVALSLNVDSFRLARVLSSEPAVREALVKQAGAVVDQNKGRSGDSLNVAVDSLIANVEKGGIAFGWARSCSPGPRVWSWMTRNSASTSGCGSPWLSLAGILVTTIALSFGAPFWFDALNKVTNLRQSGGPPSSSR